jgi:hypothetical protein
MAFESSAVDTITTATTKSKTKNLTPKEERKEPAKLPASPFTPFITISPDKLPSRGIPYPEDATVKYRPYVYGEVKRISQEKGMENYLEFALGGIETSFPTNDLTIGDALYLGLLRKISTLGATKYTIPWKCPKCGHRNIYQFQSDQIEFKDLSEDVENFPIEVDFTLQDGSEKTIEFSPVTVGDYIALKKIDKVDNELYYTAAQVRNLPFEEALKFLDALPVSEGVTLEAVDQLLYHEVKQLTLTCANTVGALKCEHQVPYEIDRGESLLIPFRESQGNVRDKIRTRKTPEPKHK